MSCRPKRKRSGDILIFNLRCLDKLDMTDYDINHTFYTPLFNYNSASSTTLSTADFKPSTFFPPAVAKCA